MPNAKILLPILLCLAVAGAARADDWSAWQRAYDPATRTRLALQGFPTIPALKELLALKQKQPSWRRLRPPLINLTDEEAARLRAAGAAAGLL